MLFWSDLLDVAKPDVADLATVIPEDDDLKELPVSHGTRFKYSRDQNSTYSYLINPM